MRAAAAIVALALGACAAAAPAAPLAGTRWELVELRSSDDAIGIVRATDPSRYTLAFDAAGNAAFRLDCNRGRGTFTATEAEPGVGRLEFGPIATTRAMCPPGSLDARLGRELPWVRIWVRDGDTLRLELFADGGQQIWRRAP
jgi:heat shock protein HslJ